MASAWSRTPSLGTFLPLQTRGPESAACTRAPRGQTASHVFTWLREGRPGRVGASVPAEALFWGAAPGTIIWGFSWCVAFNRCYYGLESDIPVINLLGFILCPNNAVRGST